MSATIDLENSIPHKSNRQIYSRRIKFDNTITNEQKIELEKELDEWEKSIESKSKNQIPFERNLEDTEAYFTKDENPKSKAK